MKSSSVMLLDTPLKTKTFCFEASAEWYDFGSDTLMFGLKTSCILGSLCRIAKSLGVRFSYENPALLRLLDLVNSEAWMVLPQFAHDSNLCVKLWVNICGNEWSPIFVARELRGGLASRWERR